MFKMSKVRKFLLTITSKVPGLNSRNEVVLTVEADKERTDRLKMLVMQGIKAGGKYSSEVRKLMSSDLNRLSLAEVYPIESQESKGLKERTNIFARLLLSHTCQLTREHLAHDLAEGNHKEPQVNPVALDDYFDEEGKYLGPDWFNERTEQTKETTESNTKEISGIPA